MIKNTELAELLESQNIFEFHSDKEDEGFNVGYLLAYDDDYVLMQQVDDEGRVSSYLIIRRDADAFIDQTDTYLDNILKLQKIAKKYETYNLKSDFTLQNNEKSILLNVLSYLKDSQNVMDYILNDDEYFSFGIIKEISEDTVTINDLDENLNLVVDKDWKAKIQDINNIEFDGVHELLLTKLIEK